MVKSIIRSTDFYRDSYLATRERSTRTFNPWQRNLAKRRSYRIEGGVTMGSEAVCTTRFGGTSAKGKARLETEELWFRAEGGQFRLKIPFRAIGSVTASD